MDARSKPVPGKLGLRHDKLETFYECVNSRGEILQNSQFGEFSITETPGLCHYIRCTIYPYSFGVFAEDVV